MRVVVRKLHSTSGRVRIALWRSASGFPSGQKGAFATRVVRIGGARVTAVFRDVPPGAFAVAVHHDEDGDGKMDTNLVGMPAEGYGASRDAPARFGPPKYEDARLSLTRGEQKRVVISMRY